MLTLVLVVILAALVFEFINGFHDTANSIATVVATKVLSPGWAVMLAAFMNLIGALTGTAVALTIASGLLNTNVVEVTPQVILCALLGGIIWNLITWWKGLPSSSSHALIGGLCGAGLAAAHNNWDALIWSERLGSWAQNKGLLWKVFVPMITSPIAGFLLGIVVMVLLWALIAGLAKIGGAIGRLARPRIVNAFFGKAQIASAAYMGFAHGHNDAQKTMGIIAVLLYSQGALGSEFHIPLWVILSCQAAMALGTLFGGWRIVHTMGSRITRLHPVQGFCAEAGGAATLFLATYFGVPVSTTHTITGAIVGVGAARKVAAVRWNVASNVVVAWILTMPAAALMGAAFYQLCKVWP